ncbi:hypothetical protein TNCT_166671 [Trichonephila clavata]|uniref:Uncharacterized protein n=1 Tax=Trichonephila clavata TaxID=2740835 RepID=A0A8X6G8W0_TRICU|nr:hypothetical protein TNCT_166671 [Trichonephila clavata]
MAFTPASDSEGPLFAPSFSRSPVRGLFQGLSLDASQTPPPFLTAAPPSPDLPATPICTDNAGVPHIVVDVLLVPVRPAPAPIVHHSLASGVSNTLRLSARFECHFCGHSAKTQKGLNHSLVRVHRYIVAPKESALLFPSPPVSSQCESLTITPSGFVDLTLRTTSLVVAPAPSAQVPSADTTFTISSVKLSPFQQEWIKRCSEATLDSIDQFVQSLADCP